MAFFLKLKLNYLSKMHGYPQSSFCIPRVLAKIYFLRIVESLSNHDDEGNKTPTNLHIWQRKTVFLHALHVHFSFFDIL